MQKIAGDIRSGGVAYEGSKPLSTRLPSTGAGSGDFSRLLFRSAVSATSRQSLSSALKTP